VIYLDGQPVSVAGQHAGTDGGSPSVWFRFNLPDGRIVLAQTTLKLLQRAADSLLARYGRV
jgi:hypothetical protein